MSYKIKQMGLTHHTHTHTHTHTCIYMHHTYIHICLYMYMYAYYMNIYIVKNSVGKSLCTKNTTG